ncbi:hypothetical protein GSI_07811 [Ganoderma sinense ZZ0214-1]|uniref:Ricin B lectin domain-containing protein n=1 Tax=Ganoderma sinense ZZ0214-1 TaxID=1077348 RepID=A0A2G8S816_9APHY|nr:hypothetical protein GSI_07811 [Ganoderma sinense ZZ0214-1]
MSLETGQYYITSADSGGFPIGRSSREDRSTKPKGIFRLPKGTESVWDVEKLANGNYTLKNGGAIVGGTAGDGVFAYVIPDQTTGTVTTEWKFIFDDRRANEGTAFVITEAPTGRSNGWVTPASDDDESYPGPQVVLRVTIRGPSQPPFYPANEVFFFKKVNA